MLNFNTLNEDGSQRIIRYQSVRGLSGLLNYRVLSGSLWRRKLPAFFQNTADKLEAS